MEANLTQANLEGAILYDACLREVDFEETNLTDASLRGADLYKARFDEANLSGVNFKHVEWLEYASFYECTFKGNKGITKNFIKSWE